MPSRNWPRCPKGYNVEGTVFRFGFYDLHHWDFPDQANPLKPLNRYKNIALTFVLFGAAGKPRATSFFNAGDTPLARICAPANRHRDSFI